MSVKGLADLTPEQLARLHLRLREMRGPELLPAAIPRRTGTGPAPLSFPQQRLWFLNQLDPRSTAYNLAFPLHVQGPVHVPVLERAITELVRRHQALRTVFHEREGDPVQVVLPPAPQRVPVGDLCGLPATVRNREMHRLFAREAARPFDLERGPLLRVFLLRLEEREWGLVFQLHHIVSDGWSMGVMARELSALYASSLDRSGPALPELPLQYADYAVWQRERLTQEVVEAQLAWWRERLAGAPPVLELPTDRPRSAGSGGLAGFHRIAFPAELGEGLRKLGRREGATLFMVILAGMQALLSRYSGQEDVTVGSPINGRTRPELEGLIGFFVNTLALRVDLSGNPSFRKLLGRVREVMLGAFAHQDLPFERLVEALAPERSLTQTPLFQVTLVLQNTRPAERMRLGEASLTQVQGGGSMAMFDLSLALEESGEELQGMLTYRKELFDAATAERMLEHLVRLLKGAVTDPERRLSGVELLGEEEREQVVEGWNATEAEYPRELCVHQLFEAQADRTPAAVAVVYADGTLTYAQLDTRANRLARFLRGRGVGPDTCVGLCLERGPEMMVALLGILKAGAAYVPLDPEYPADRLAYMLESSAAPVLLTQASLAGQLPASAAAVVRVDADKERIEAESGERVVGGALPESLAYVIYTSGSTGLPKGVAMPHRPLVNLLAWQERDWRAPVPAATLQFATISFDVSFQEIFSAWSTGGRVVLIGEETRYDPAAILETIEREGVERLFMPAVALQNLAEVADAQGRAPAALREVVTAGEQLRVSAPLRRWMGVLGAPLYNQYGPSETHVVTSLALAGDPAEWPLLPSIGVPVANTRCYVLDGRGEPAPVGVPGELYLGGVSLARGYLSRPDLTAERFLPDPLSAAGGARLYRTGDRVRWLAGGTLEFLGRVDEQVKVRGFRIEPGEVEAALERHPEVREAVVVVREDAPGEKRLVGYVVAAEGAEASPTELRAHLKASLPEYMVPGAFVVLERLPLTPSGKVARRALPAPERSSAEDFVAPRTPAEEILAGIWGEVLRVERVGAEDDFFALGGHSLLATRVVSRVRQAFGVELPLRAIFEAPTVAGLAVRIGLLQAGGKGTQTPPLVRVARDGSPAPLSFAQQRLWFIDRLEPGSAAYNMPFALRLRGRFDPAVLERSLTEIVRRHETLRTVFATVDGEPVQVIRDAAPVALPVTDLRSLPAESREVEVLRLVSEEAALPFDLATGPLLRVSAVRLDEAEWGVLFTMHHIVSDGWSIGVLIGEVSALYDALAEGREAQLPELPVQYADYAAWQRGWLTGETLETKLGYWRDKLAGAPPLLELPTDRPRPQVQDPRGGIVRVELPADVSAGLRALSRREGATAFMTLLAAWQLLLARYAGQEDVSVGTPIAGRTRLETEPLIGFFVNTLVLRTDLSGDVSFQELLGRVRETTLGAYQHQEIPFERLVEELAPERSLAHSPLFQAMFVLQNNERGGLRMGELEMEPLAADGGEIAKFDLTLGLGEDEQGFAGSLSYRAGLWDEATMKRMAAHFARLVEALVEDAARPAAGVTFLTDEERARVLLEWNATGREYPLDCIHDLVEEQARRTPGAVAAVCGAEHVTYGELDRLADRLAVLLARRGIGLGSYVPVLMERGLEVPLAMLGVMKAGAAFSPLDVRWPAARVREILDDLGCDVVLVGRDAPFTEAELGRSFLRLDLRDPEDADGAPHTAVRVGPEDPIYVIYTSGSTGKPKGVVVPHRGIANRFRWMDEYFGREAAAAVLQTTRHVFDSAVWQLFWPLTGGGRTVLPASDDVLAAGPLTALIQEQRVTMTDFVPSVFNVLVPWLLRDEEARRSLESLRAVVVGGEQITPGTTYAFMRHFPGVAVVNLYGPTEASIGCVCYRVTDDEGGRIPIGRPISNTQALVLDERRRLVPVQVPGELYLSGACLAAGYLNDPERTRAAFVENPFAELGSERMYRTGDRVRWLADGNLEYLGRVDFQAKVRGFRIEPGEIESVLREQNGVRDAVVVVRGAEGDRRLVAYVAGEGAELDVAALRARLRERLPEHMVPAAVVVLEALPLTPNGKVDRRALPAPERSEDAYVAPRTPAEEMLAGIYADVLGVERAGAEDDFFALGGHSLLATRVVSRVRQAFGVEPPLRAIFEAPTVAGLAVRIGLLQAGGEGTQTPPLVRVARDGSPLPLSFAQQRLWVVDQLEPGSAAYNMPYALRLRGRLQLGALRASLDALARRHETLRTVFAEKDGEPVQVIHDPASVALPVLDLGDLPQARREAEAQRLAAAEALRPFDLSRGPLLRSTLLRLGSEEHVVLFTLHHVVSDGWSMDVLVREVSLLYGAFSRGETPHLAELPIQYADYAVWQREWMSGATLEEQLSYWRARLAGAPPLLEILTDRPRALGQSPRAGSHGFVLSPELSDGLRALSRRGGATLFMTLLAGWQALLARYAGQEDVVVGSPVAGRTRRETEGLIGFFVNMLALRAELGGDPTWSELLGRVREAALGAYDHQELPFERLVEDLGAERSLTHTPIFQVTFALNRSDTRDERLGLGDLAVEAFGQGGAGIARFDLNMVFTDAGEGLGGMLVYRPALFEAGTMARLAGHLEVLLESLAADPRRRLSEVPLLRGYERTQVLESWNDTAAEFPQRCVHELIAEQSARTPGAPAVVFEDEVLTYAQLERRANQLAHSLQRRGIGPDVRVGLCLERGVELIVAILGVLKAGGAYVPLDPKNPAERLAHMVHDAAAPVVLTQARTADLLDGSVAQLLRLDADWHEIGRESDAAPTSGVSPENLAYVLYTSGSTGRPKGVCVSHRSVASHLGWVRRALLSERVESLPATTSPSFDASLKQVLGPLLQGAAVWILAEDTVHDAGALARAVAGRQGLALNCVPSLWQALLEQEGSQHAWSELRVLLLGGEALPRNLVEETFRSFPQVEVWNLYGPTEATVNAVAGRVEPGRKIGIGRPVGNARAYVLDRQGQPVPVGVSGELYLGGAGVARGYLGRPELTAERFIPDAFGAAGGRLYRTGDRVRWLPAGELEFLGRVDQQVKIRGFRIEPGEIEAVLLEQDGVRQALVTAREDAPGQKRLAAYVTAEEGAGLAAAALRASLGARLPEYMVPGAIILLERLPLNANGKVDLRALPAPEYGRAEASFAAPRTPAEENLATIWAEVLRLERVGAHDNFFEIGGHSLLAIRMQALVRQVFGAEMPLRSIFEHPTVAALAPEIERAAGWAVPTPPIVPGERAEAVLARLDRMPEEEVDRRLGGPSTARRPDGVGPASAGHAELPLEEKRLLLARKLRAEIARGAAFPLSFAQQRLWVVHQMDPESAAYNMPYALRLVGGLDVEVLGRALTALVRRHETLRTVFPADRGVPVQRVLPAAPVLPLVTDMRRLAAGALEAEVARLVREESVDPFDLASGPLLRVRVLRTGEAEDVVLFTLHHIVTDGWSQEVLVRDLSELYTAGLEKRTPVLPDLPVQYADYATWQRGGLSGEVLEEHLGYWRRQLAGAPPLLDLPTDRPRLPFLGDRAGSRSFVLSPEVSHALRALSRREGATLFMTLLAAFQELLSRWSGEEDVVVGTPAAGRTQGVVENVIGFFVNLLALRTRFSDDPSFREALGRARESVLEGHAHQDLPFEKLVDALQPERSPAVTPLFQVLFALQVPAREALRLGGLGAARMEGAGQAAKFDLSLEMVDDGERLAGSLLFRTELFDGSTIERMLEHLARLLEQVADDAGLRLSGLALLGPAERRLVVEEWNRTEARYPAELCIHEVFERQAERTPEAVAVVYEGRSLTFAELDARANQVAHHLARMGVGPEVRVGLCLERSLELMVCTLGVMKAGGAYVPLDPAHPGERIRYVLADSGVAVLLTQERLRDRLPGLEEVRVVCVDREWARIAAECTRAPRSGAGPENLCYVIYTSGSTGRPKGVAMHHRGVCNYIDWGVRFYGADQGSGAPVFSSMAVDLTITNLLPLFAGRPVRFLREDSPVDALAEVLRERPGFGLIKITPTHLSLLTPLLTPEEAQAAARTLVVGADFLSAETTLFMQEHAPGVRLMNEYGPTETVVGCSAYLLPNGVHRAGPVPVGGPIQNLRFYVLDRHMEPVPAGVGGELYIGGAGVARGYLGRPGLSAEKFVPDPFAGAGARMYRTGDRARWQADGNLLILGRTDNQVKVRGYRVELGEIEATLRRHEQVSGCLVVLREDRPGDRRLVAYVVGEADAGSLREHLRRSVPEYMVPGAFVRLDSLPHTSTGKFDPRTLPAPEYRAVARYVAPRTPVEETLAEIWAEVLGLERVGVEESFFELGGDSILAIQVVSRARWAGVEITPRQMLEHHTITRLAAVAGRRDEAEARAAEGGHPKGAVTLTPIQAAFFKRGHAVPWHHNLSVLLGVDPAVPDAVLEAAVYAVLGHHDALRLRFRQTDSGWEQWYGEEVGIELERIDLSSVSREERQRVQGEITGRRQASLDLEHGPLGRAVLFDHGEEGRVLFLVLHHLVVDGVSWRLIREDLDRACAQAEAGKTIDLGPRSASFQKWAASLVAYAAGDAARGQAGYWLAQGPEGIPPLPVDGEGEQTIESAREVAVQLGAEETRALLQEVPAVYRTQINDVLLCALVDAVGEWTGSSRTRLALEGHGRAEEVGPGLDLTRSVGWFTSIYPVVLDTAGAVGIGERLSRVKEQLLAVPAQGVGYGVLRYLSPDVEVRRALAAQPEPRIVFNYLGQFDQGLAPGLRVRFTDGPRGLDVADKNHRPHPLSVGASIVDGRLHVHWRYDRGIYRQETVERLAGRYLEALRCLIAHCRETGTASSTAESGWRS
ncbi:MAG TPA: non-ribosomal peptide synthase/polyketide synthase [Longimicrobiaceae bacterium]|nr:non-ribosomal peptide synthase/polyketide synthase [Longimicrobiaceae bacterium]